MIMPEATSSEACIHVAERVRAAVADTPVATDKDDVSVTIRLGVAQLASFDEDVDSLINRADEALYDAKEAGRNRVAKAGDDLAQT